jgi:hypothetical protein
MFDLTFDDSTFGKAESSFALNRISPSMLGMYLNCPLCFYYAYIAKIEIPQTRLHLLFGSGVHMSIEAMYNGNPDPMSIFKTVFKKEDLDDEGQLKFSEYYLLGLEMIKNYMESHPTLDKLYNLNAGKSEFRFKEHVVNPITGQMSRIPLSGILDRITDDGKIIEYKTSKTKWCPSESRFKVQSLLYNLWYFTKYGKIADETLYLVLLKKYKQTKRDEVMQVISYKPTLEDLAGAWEEVDFVLDRIEAGMFERPESGHPRYCDCYKYERLLGLKSN